MKFKKSVFLLSLSITMLAIFIVATPDLYAQSNIGQSVLEKFTSRTDNWWGTLQGHAFSIFKIVVILEIALFGIRVALQQSQLGEIFGQFVNLLLYICFIAAVIKNYQPWAESIALEGLKPLAGIFHHDQ